MKTWLLAFCVSFAGTAAASSAPHAHFTGYLTDESATAHEFGSMVALGNTHTIELSDLYRLELQAASSDRSIARLLDADGTVLHEAESLGPVSARPSFAYRVCDGAVTFMSPAPTSERALGC